MSRRSVVPVLILLAAACPLAAQDNAPPASAAPDSAAQPVPRKKGMFGKLKSIAGNKTVQSLAKAAACTMVPGGQFVAGAIDAASNASAAGVVQGAAGGATGSACYGGLAGMAGGAGAAGVAGTAAGAGAGAALGATGMGNAAGVMAGMPGMAGASTAAAMAAMSAMSAMSAHPGAGGQPGELSAKDEKKMRSTLKKQGMSSEEIDQTIATYRQQQSPQGVAAPALGPDAQPGGLPNVASAGARPVGLPDDYDAQLKAGKLVLIELPWKPATAELIAGTEDGVRISFLRIVESLSFTEGTYRVDVYVSESDKNLAQARATAVVTFLGNAGLPAEQKLAGKPKTAAKSSEPRVEIVKN
jgi:hypothetical protein